MTSVLLWAGLACSAALLLAGCGRSASDPVPEDQSAKDQDVKVPRDVVAYGIDLGMAEYIAEECPGEFRLNRDRKRERVREFEDKYGKNPDWADYNMEMTVSPKKMQRRLIAYIQRRDVLLTDPETWCAAGRAEVAEKTRIGKLLVAR